MSKRIEVLLKRAELYKPTGNEVVDGYRKRLLEIQKRLLPPVEVTEPELAVLVGELKEHIEDGKKQKKPLQPTRLPEVIFNDKFCVDVLPSLISHFERTDRHLLEQLIIRRQQPSRQLRFNGPSNALVEFFKRVWYNRLLSSDTLKPLAEWICLNFQYKKGAEFESFSISTVRNVIKNSTKKGKAKNHILTDKVPYNPIVKR